jgi:hypothetical protein
LEYRSQKERVIRMVSQLFAAGGDLTAADIERTIRTKVSEQILHDPTMAADHLRVALVELGLLTRTNDGVTYHFNRDAVLSPHNIRRLFGAQYPVERIRSMSHLLKKMAKAAEESGILRTA